MSDVQTILRPARRPLLPRAGRCHECGQKCRERCRVHTYAPMVQFSTSELIAYQYVSWLRIDADGFIDAYQDRSLPAPEMAQVVRWIETFNRERFPGVQIGELALAATFWAAWGRKSLDELDYGPTPSVRAESGGRL